MAGSKYLTNNAGTLTEVVSSQTSAGVADAGKIPALNAAGVLDSTVVNSTITSAGAGSSGKLPALDASGRLDITTMPAGIVPDTKSILTSEALTGGNLVNVYNNAGTANVRKADASVVGKEAHGYVLAGFGSGVAATVYFEGPNTSQAGMTPGNQFLSATTPGMTTATAPSGAGEVVQRVGFAVSATEMNFQSGDPIVLA